MRSTVYQHVDLLDCLVNLKVQLGKQDKAKYSFEGIAKAMGFASRSMARSYFKRKNTFSRGNLEILTKYFGLKDEERKYLELLRLAELTKDLKKLGTVYHSIATMRKKHLYFEESEILGQQMKIYSRWYLVPLMLTFNLKNPPRSIEEIQACLYHELSREEIRDGLKDLLEMKFVSMEDGRYHANGSLFSCWSGVPKPILHQYHKLMGERALEALIRLPFEKRYNLGLSVCVQKVDVPLIRERFTKFLNSIYQDFSTSQSDSVYHLNLQWFEVARDTGLRLDHQGET